MPLTNTELRYYDSNVLRLPADKRKEYHEQVDRLIAELSRSIRTRPRSRSPRWSRPVRSPNIRSCARRRPIRSMSMLFSTFRAEHDKETLESLNDTIYDLLIKIYPNKAVEDFEIQRKAATVTFVGTGLSVDIVPVIEDENRPAMAGSSTSRTARRSRPARHARSSSFAIART